MSLFFPVNYQNRQIISATIILTAVLVWLQGCTISTTAPVPSHPAPSSFSDSGERKAPDRWWQAFGDRKLNRLIEQSLDTNFSLAVAYHRVREAKAIERRESASMFPKLDGLLEGEIDNDTSENETSLRLGLAATYEVDLWGRLGSQVTAERFRAEAARMDYQTAAITLAAEVTGTWFALMEARSQLGILEEQINTNAKVLQLIKSRFGTGQSRSVDVLRQNRLLEATREQKVIAESRIRVLQHSLAALLGRYPKELQLADTKLLPELPPLPSTGLPAELIQRRPDIRSSFLSLQAADKDLASAISNRFPRFTLTGSLSTESDGGMFENWARSFTAELLAPLIDGGARAAEVDRTTSLKKQRLYEYLQSVVKGMQEVEDALIQERKQQERLASLELQLTLADRAYKRLRGEYFNGVSNYIDVLVALTDKQRLRREYLSARLALLQFRINLYRALAGGFSIDREKQQR